MRNAIMSCTACPLHLECQALPVPFQRDVNSSIFVVGSWPDMESDIMCVPFEGRDGKLLSKYMRDAAIRPDQIHKTYMVKCYPNKAKVKKEYVKVCKSWLWKEIQEFSPKVVVTLGVFPTNTLLKTKFRLKDVVGKFIKVNYMSAMIAPWYDTSLLITQSSKQMETDTIDFFKRVKEVCDVRNV